MIWTKTTNVNRYAFVEKYDNFFAIRAWTKWRDFLKSFNLYLPISFNMQLESTTILGKKNEKRLSMDSLSSKNHQSTEKSKDNSAILGAEDY